jgi:hypothetical protein
LAISRAGTRTPRSPRAIETAPRNPKRAGSPQRPDGLDAQSPGPLQDLIEPARTDRRRLVSEQLARRRGDNGDRVELLCMSAPRTIVSRVPFSSGLKRTIGRHGLLRALPRSLQLTPEHSATGDKRDNRTEVSPAGPTASKRVSPPPVGTIPAASDITDKPNHNGKPRRRSARRWVNRRVTLPLGSQPPSTRTLALGLAPPPSSRLQ